MSHHHHFCFVEFCHFYPKISAFFCAVFLVCLAWCVPHQLYTELSQSYQTLITSEAQFRQSHQELSGLLAQRDKDILELQSQVQQQQLQLQQHQQQLQQHLQQRDQLHMPQQSRHAALCTPLHRQTNFKVKHHLKPSVRKPLLS